MDLSQLQGSSPPTFDIALHNQPIGIGSVSVKKKEEEPPEVLACIRLNAERTTNKDSPRSRLRIL